ncbi:hypothetical protein OG735_13550 [Streptomyces sp. NBC_01210]|uniref:hypothetical protein n=1 Tax=Streptomyces sp. NBC_01210 TaxID=2903774 RepID=UPI002E128C7C|nr:hypothetical protein OG735_13550 [Streptomyces sp. NBC_01210]
MAFIVRIRLLPRSLSQIALIAAGARSTRVNAHNSTAWLRHWALMAIRTLPTQLRGGAGVMDGSGPLAHGFATTIDG